VYAQVVVNRPIQRRPPLGADPLREEGTHRLSHTYRLPERLREAARAGLLVQVPLGASTALGVIVAVSDEAPGDLDPSSIRDVAGVLDLLPVVTPVQIRMACWLAEAYLAPLSQAMRLMLPPGLEARTFVVVSELRGKPVPGEGAAAEAETPAGTASDLMAEERAALELLHRQGGRLRLATLLASLRVQDPEAVLHALEDDGWVQTHYALVPPRPAPARVEYIRLLAEDAVLEASLTRLGHASKQGDLLLLLARRADAPVAVSELCDRAGCSLAPLRSLVERGWVRITAPRTLVVACPGSDVADLGRAAKQAGLVSELQQAGGTLELSTLLARTGASMAPLLALEQKGLVRRVVEEPVALLLLPEEEVLDRVLELRGGQKERAVLNALRGSTGRVWVGGIYAQTGADLATLRALAERGLVSLHAQEYDRPAPATDAAPPRLTADQERVWREVSQGMGSPERPWTALLHGVTGSGKTEIYLRALASILAAGQRALILVPEISLTAQTVRRFEARFPGRVALLHSQLSLGQRYAVWDRVRRGEVDVLIGPRSALFAPVSRLGLIVVDEAHDESYKQSEPLPLPAYRAIEVAVALARETGATLLLGSATPDLVDYYRAERGEYHLLQLSQRILSAVPRDAAPARRWAASPRPADLPPVRIVDLRQELKAGNRSIFSRPLQEALRETLAAGEQAILFLNRRGAATFVLCRDCGYVARCPNCEVPLTYHSLSAAGKLVCHRCNHREPTPDRCPDCGGRHIRYFGLGTERVEAAMRQLFPMARLLRWDADTASGLDHERFLQAFGEHRADVLIGTQMIAKGLDLPLVTLVGVISADTALQLPDYRAAERTFQLLAQVAGRAGRSQRGGQAILQTYDPEHYAIQAAARHDYVGFFRQELQYRRNLGFPPFSRLVALRFSHTEPRQAQVEAERLGRWLAAEIRGQNLVADLVGPAPCFFGRVQGRYRWQIVVRATDPMPLLKYVALPRGWQVDVDPVSLL
jgi:primosomal protein N' (replication factor Y) (superfamily II helicase)